MLAHADCQNILEHRGTQRVAQRNTEKEGATRPREQRTENREQRTENRERPCGATDEAAVHVRRQPKSQASKPLTFQASTNQEIQEVQEMQERAASARQRDRCASGVSRKSQTFKLPQNTEIFSRKQ